MNELQTRDKKEESLYLSIGTTKLNKGRIYYYDEMIASDLNDFFEKYLEDERFFLIDK